ncbi:hypothetical protein COEREDRAFT_82460 [Coemansia reversa NRRL 1564]|uniref:Peptidase S1 domain-containing protein n=1 Tax=Coemansia reversa (strain ATCC 12441 / NRRL 1564) TaxID=763665 RepID=A0A2G5B754_COERN|nr:hypothetical protein COEREDRAFT_82460 [Coemansia reversa NRRL 1564]|eukprot:PIA14856.1 hypothetical protein COEREDRAFT_82460 [Coemansia reversa NRRL 1564]
MTHWRIATLLIVLLAAIFSSVIAEDTAGSNSTSISPRLKAARFIAGLFWASPKGLQRRCAATIITGNTLVTSAICAKSDYSASKYGQGGWKIVTDSVERYSQEPSSSVTTYSVKDIKIDECSNFAIILIDSNISFGGDILPLFISSHEIKQEATMHTYRTSDPSGNSFMSLTQGSADSCDQFLPGYVEKSFLCTQPVPGQSVTTDYLGGDPIIGFSMQPDGPLAVLLGVTGLYYSTLEKAQTADVNDPTAFRFNAIAAAHVNDIASVAGVEAKSLVSGGVLG